jgi:hypothetical protein
VKRCAKRERGMRESCLWNCVNESLFLSFSAPTPMREKSGASFIHSCKSGPPFFLGLALHSHYLLSAPPSIYSPYFHYFANWSSILKIHYFYLLIKYLVENTVI